MTAVVTSSPGVTPDGAVPGTVACLPGWRIPPARKPIVHMPAILEVATVPEPMRPDDFTGAVHERHRQSPATLIEIARSTHIMPGVGDMASSGETADTPWLVTMGGEVRDQRFPAIGEMAGDGDLVAGGLDGNGSLENTVRARDVMRPGPNWGEGEDAGQKTGG